MSFSSIFVFSPIAVPPRLFQILSGFSGDAGLQTLNDVSALNTDIYDRLRNLASAFFTSAWIHGIVVHSGASVLAMNPVANRNTPWRGTCRQPNPNHRRSHAAQTCNGQVIVVQLII